MQLDSKNYLSEYIDRQRALRAKTVKAPVHVKLGRVPFLSGR
jgi:hypothetical protein